MVESHSAQKVHGSLRTSGKGEPAFRDNESLVHNMRNSGGRGVTDHMPIDDGQRQAESKITAGKSPDPVKAEPYKLGHRNQRKNAANRMGRVQTKKKEDQDEE